MLPSASISHRTHRRLRLRIPSKKGDRKYFSLLADHFLQHQGVERLEVNTTTGSLLLILTTDVREIAEYARSKDLFVIDSGIPHRQTVTGQFRGSLERFNDQIKELTAGEIDFPSLAFLLFFFLGLYQLSKGNLVAPAWYTAFWYAFNFTYEPPAA